MNRITYNNRTHIEERHAIASIINKSLLDELHEILLSYQPLLDKQGWWLNVVITPHIGRLGFTADIEFCDDFPGKLREEILTKKRKNWEEKKR